ncbi:MAG: hypothetical protein FWE13_02705 [Firmicutes bacterium]|nr:hypothetical protein [Bacillota bacterium]
MQQTNSQKVFEAILKDDCSQIENLLKNDSDVLSYAFGRFPVLSLCYLFEATSIIKKYSDKLFNLTYYKKATEPNEAYKKFKSIAGVHLRKYPSTSIVTPPEMLALLEETPYLASNIKNLKPSQKARDNILSVCHRRNQSANFTHDKFTAKAPSLKFFQKIALIVAGVFLLTSLSLGIVALGIVSDTMGLGTASNPFRIHTHEDFLRIPERSTSHFLLQNDIILPENFFIENLSARIDGGGYTIYTSGSRPIIGTLSGHLTNTTVVVNAPTIIHISSDLSFIANEVSTSGRIADVDLYADMYISISNASEGVMIAGFAIENRGFIERVTTSGKIDIFSRGTHRVSVGGIVADNSFVGQGPLRQNGRIIESDNNMDIIVDKREANASTVVEIGGISAINKGDIIRGGNAATLSFIGSTGFAYLAGIVAYSEMGMQINNGHFGRLETTLSGNAGALLGGIAAVSWRGHFENNFSLGTVSYNSRYNEEGDIRLFSGGIIASTYGRYVALIDGTTRWEFFAIQHGQPPPQDIFNYYVFQPPSTVFGITLVHGINTTTTPNTSASARFTDSPDDFFNLVGTTEAAIRETESRGIFWER